VIYAWRMTIPANTPKTSPVMVQCRMAAGIIHRVEVQFPIGCAGLVHTYIRRGGHQLWPSNPDGTFTADGYVISFHEGYDLSEEPHVVQWYAWNEDDTYAHTLELRLGLLPPEALMPWGFRDLLGMLLRRLFGR